MVICDTNIISKLLQKNPDVVRNINNIGVENIAITPIIFIEIYRWLSLYKGIDKSQRLLYKRTLNDFKMLYLNEEISLLAMEAVTKHDSLEPTDILIGVTGVYYNIPVYTTIQNISNSSRIFLYTKKYHSK